MWLPYNLMKWKTKYHTVGTAPRYNIKVLHRGKDRSHNKDINFSKRFQDNKLFWPPRDWLIVAAFVFI